MNDLIGRVFDFEKRVFPSRNDLFAKLVADGQSPKALMISCADSRIVPEHIMQAEPGDMFVCRNAGNIVPPFATQNGGVSSTVEYAVAALGVRDVHGGGLCTISDPMRFHSYRRDGAASGRLATLVWITPRR